MLSHAESLLRGGLHTTEVADGYLKAGAKVCQFRSLIRGMGRCVEMVKGGIKVCRTIKRTGFQSGGHMQFRCLTSQNRLNEDAHRISEQAGLGGCKCTHHLRDCCCIFYSTRGLCGRQEVVGVLGAVSDE